MIAAVLVTHNSATFLPELLASIDQQTQQPDIKLAIDDNSTDATKQLLSDHGFTVNTATTNSTDITTRIAQNFVQGVNQAQQLGAKYVILGDHDDIWRPTRIAHQAAILTDHPEVSFLASDGATTTYKTATTETLRSTFPVPDNFNEMDSIQQWRYVSKHSIATGGASALAPDRISTVSVPTGWLHDRWWSLRAVREQSIWIDSDVVIDYRISPEQRVGLDTAGQGNPITWALNKITNLPLNLRKARDIAALLKETPNPSG